MTDAAGGGTPAPRTVSYELVADTPEVDLAAAVGTARGSAGRTRAHRAGRDG